MNDPNPHCNPCQEIRDNHLETASWKAKRGNCVSCILHHRFGRIFKKTRGTLIINSLETGFLRKFARSDPELPIKLRSQTMSRWMT